MVELGGEDGGGGGGGDWGAKNNAFLSNTQKVRKTAFQSEWDIAKHAHIFKVHQFSSNTINTEEKGMTLDFSWVTCRRTIRW